MTQEECRSQFEEWLLQSIQELDTIDLNTPAEVNAYDNTPVWWAEMRDLERQMRKLHDRVFGNVS